MDDETTDTEVREITTVRPPVHLLVLAGAAVALSAALLVASGMPGAVVGYLLASFVAIALVGLFRRNDLQRRQNPHYMPYSGAGRWAGALAMAGVVVAALHTWSIATELAK